MINVKAVLFIVLLVAYAQCRPCGLCLGARQECGDSTGHVCRAGFTCQRLENGFAETCLPTVEFGDVCDDDAYDNCPTFSSCDQNTLTCERDPRNSYPNDGCVINEECIGNAPDGDSTCQGQICVSDAPCSVVGCPVDQVCDVDGVDCVAKPVAGDSCTGNELCWLSSCISEICRELFTQVKDSDCRSKYDCEVGLQCENRGQGNKCYEPILHYLNPGQLIKWGDNCDASTDGGCYCNYNAKTEKFLIEESPTVLKTCQKKHANFWGCMKDNECHVVSSIPDSCARENCWKSYLDMNEHCSVSHSSRSATQCKAGTFALAVILLIAVLLLH